MFTHFFHKNHSILYGFYLSEKDCNATNMRRTLFPYEIYSYIHCTKYTLTVQDKINNYNIYYTQFV